MNKILIVEDDPHVASLYQDELEKSGFEVNVAHDGQQGLDLANESDFDLILLDLMLPGKHGVNVLRELKASDKTKNMLVYILSVLDDQIVIDQVKKFGADGYFVKSKYGPAELNAAVQGIFENKEPTPSL